MRDHSIRDNEARFEGVHCRLAISRPAPAIVVVRIEGHDVGELGTAPFRAMDDDLGVHQRIELFIDARHVRGASVDVSSDWARWLRDHKERLHHVSMLTGSRFVQLSADFVRKFAELGDVMRIYGDASAFDGALGHAIANAGRR
jgi:hypothetical protein